MVNPHIFRQYDIRGVVGPDLTPEEEFWDIVNRYPSIAAHFAGGEPEVDRQDRRQGADRDGKQQHRPQQEWRGARIAIRRGAAQGGASAEPLRHEKILGSSLEAEVSVSSSANPDFLALPKGRRTPASATDLAATSHLSPLVFAASSLNERL